MRIAVAVDGSDNAVRAAKYAIILTQSFPNARLEVIYVADYNKAKEDYLLAQTPESLTLKREQKIQPIVELAKEANVNVATLILKGRPSDEIIRYVNDENIDHMVIGSRGLNSFQEMIVGSVSHKVMKHVKCPVTIVK